MGQMLAGITTGRAMEKPQRSALKPLRWMWATLERLQTNGSRSKAIFNGQRGERVWGVWDGCLHDPVAGKIMTWVAAS